MHCMSGCPGCKCDCPEVVVCPFSPAQRLWEDSTVLCSTSHWRWRPEATDLATQFSEACQSHITQAAVGPVVIVIHPPTLDHVFHFIQM
jgi:hypothetical protein